MKLDLSLSPSTKTNSTWIADLNERAVKMKSVGQKRKYFKMLIQAFFNNAPKVAGNKSKIARETGLYQMQMFLHSNGRT